MNQFIGTKIINAKPMKLKAATELLGRDFGYKGPLDENDDYDGYLVEYHDGYQAWSPGYAFNSAYRPITGMSFGLAVEAMKMGKRVCRAGWNGKGMWLGYVEADNYTVGYLPIDITLQTLPWIGMKTADDKFVPWLASQTDVLADDWMIVE